ncbi:MULTISPECIES: hypothetical protein [Actinoplanes]|uniref:hypothetical protein n=1 Tax=Actinoplanes TaxID=1865 RepID=UPI0005F2943C|nr:MULTISPECIES: hypothetical protein [Actinoplanes]GLY07898.1 hypothetical protein Acsp01_82770 [Actinoplanes sp. NBRC 101535]
MFRRLAARIAFRLQATAEINELTRDHRREALVAASMVPGPSALPLLFRRAPQVPVPTRDPRF